MSRFEVIEELGFTARLQLRETEFPTTPWLLQTQLDQSIFGEQLSIVVLHEDGPRTISGTLLDCIPDYAVITPLLMPEGQELKSSKRFELELFLNRLDQLVLPQFFGVSLNDHTEQYISDLLERKPSFFTLANSIHKSPRALLNLVIRLRNQIPRDIALYLPGGVSIGMQSILVGAGVDILDTTVAAVQAARGIFMQDGFMRKNYLKYDYEELYELNLEEMNRDFEGIIDALDLNQLFSRMARDAHASTQAAVAFKLMQRLLLTDLSRFPQMRDNRLEFIGDEALNHPEVLAFQKRVIERYHATEPTNTILLLPCSARKPYRNSKSHVIYENAIGDALRHRRSMVEVWSITSPLGIVPRPIETIYPARNYDIPVTGVWSSDEVQRVGSLLQSLLNRHQGYQVIVHVSSDYDPLIDFVSKTHEVRISWLDDKPRSKEAINKLKSTLKETITEDLNIPKSRKVEKIAKRDIPGLIKFQHGEKASISFERTRILGRPPRPIQIQQDKQHYIIWDMLRGEIRLTPIAALQLALTSNNWILMDTEKLKGSTAYAAGVKEASIDISPGDEVLLFNASKTRLIGVGTATLSGITMNQLDYGRVANIRKRCNLEVKQ